ncbi:hypothetical protein PFICI_11074 [Pestalotiopsis fici W106-1]|uniref:Zn(2)-C6 fungal-type domain-containing protein n=1 Tax=Pestalotiopsis fici (strain W106-1 / CGMCC3.15140) TaxID=1229662 RepID=W3WTN3_PESFW|nr:uncharacterized protein PFICI_11074 [Pestalotiopsis fici W106-1]ETS77200.1 hypothetical protein PFICI_11074 [Pestalotiopsis fici W106-1]
MDREKSTPACENTEELRLENDATADVALKLDSLFRISDIHTFKQAITISDDLSHVAKIEERQLLALRDKNERLAPLVATVLNPLGPTASNKPLRLKDYQIQLMLLEQQNKKRLMLARQEQDIMFDPPVESPVNFMQPEDPALMGGPALSRKRKRLLDDNSDTQLSPDVLEMDAVELRSFIAALEERAIALGASYDVPKIPSSLKHQILYRIFEEKTISDGPKGKKSIQKIVTGPYFDPPEWVGGQDETGTLRCQLPLQNFDLFLEKNKDLAFIVYKTYDLQVGHENESQRQKVVVNESIHPITDELKEAVKVLLESEEEFFQLHQEYKDTSELTAPYLWVFHQRDSWESVLEGLPQVLRNQTNMLWEYIMDNHGEEYAAVDTFISSGQITSNYIKYLFKPGDIIVESKNDQHLGYMAKSWPHYEGKSLKARQHKGAVPDNSSASFHGVNSIFNHRGEEKVVVHKWTIEAWHWEFDGQFRRRSGMLWLSVEADPRDTEKGIAKSKHNADQQQNDSGIVNIDELGIFPLSCASEEIIARLRRRGRSFWTCRNGAFMSYRESTGQNGSTLLEERYMIDLKTYHSLHKDNKAERTGFGTGFVHEISFEAMEKDEPPDPTFEFLLPLTIKGFNLRKKKWYDLAADRISPVKWNKEAFQKVVIDPKAKDLILALVNNQLASEVSTDLIEGKGNGLIMLLHGGPGTGKTLTAESVAEISEKPLYRVTCGDVGTKAEDVEKYLESVLHLGKLWGCVVLLDEADVFLEERSLRDLERNALVSVFLRVLEYYEGILILTSNRVGTFDEAFKSRIQLALHYPTLGPYQRLRIWENFLDRLAKLDDRSIDLDDLRYHLEDLQKEDMNGRQIRNAITTARQYAKWKKVTLTYQHLKDVIEVSGRFDQYLSKVRGGLSEDQLAEDEGPACATCRVKSRRCDRGRPSCNRCLTKGLTCGGYPDKFRFCGIASRGKLKGKKIPTADGPEISLKGSAEQPQQPESLPSAAPLATTEDDNHIETLHLGAPSSTLQLESASDPPRLSTPREPSQTRRDGPQNVETPVGERRYSDVDPAELNSAMTIHPLPDPNFVYEMVTSNSPTHSESPVHSLLTRIGNSRIRSQADALLEHYVSEICPHQIQQLGAHVANPYESYIVPLAKEPVGLLYAILGLAASHLGQEQSDRDLQYNVAVECRLLSLSELGSAIRRAISTEMSNDFRDAIFATIQILLLQDVCESGVSENGIHISGAFAISSNLLKLDTLEPLRHSRTIFFLSNLAWLDIIRAFANPQRLSFSQESRETLVMLIDSRFELVNGCPKDLFILIGEALTCAKARGLQDIGKTEFEQKLRRILRQLYSWNRHQYQCPNDDARWVNVAEAFRHTCILRVLRLLDEFHDPRDPEIQESVHAILDAVSGISKDCALVELMVLPLFMAGADAMSPHSRHYVKLRLDDIRGRSRMSNPAPDRLLQQVWDARALQSKHDRKNIPWMLFTNDSQSTRQHDYLII